MKRRKVNHDPDVSHEPHLAGRNIESDETSELDGEPSRASEVPLEDERDLPIDEPSLAWRKLDRTMYPGYAELLQAKRAATPWWLKTLIVLGAGLVAGPFAVFGAFYKTMLGEGGIGLLAIVVFAPVLEEMLKVACVLWIVEKKPWLLPGAWAIVLIGAMGGLGFAAIENVFYLYVYFPDHDPSLVQWRWTVNVALHTGCTIIATLGIAKMWRRVMLEGKPADVTRAFGWLVTAMVIHGAYNAFAVLGGQFGLTP